MVSCTWSTVQAEDLAGYRCSDCRKGVRVSLEVPHGLFLRSSVSDHVRVDLDRIGTRAAELAASFGVRAPHVVAGNVPTWVTERLRYSVQKRQPVVTVGAGFGDLSPAELDGALANAIVAGNFYRIGAFKTGFIFGLCFAAVGFPLVYIAAYHGTPKGVLLSAFGILYVFGYLLTFALRSRRIVHRVDRRVAEVMG